MHHRLMMRAGTLLGGRYRIDASLPEAGRGAVYRGRDLRLDRAVAIKLFPRSAAGGSDAIELARAEARTLATVRHPNLVETFDVGDDPMGAFVVTGLGDAESLEARVGRTGPLALREAASVVVGVASALAELHAHGMVHGHITASDVLLHADGGTRLLDFGLVCTGRGQGDQVMAGPRMAADVYSLGVIAYLALLGMPMVPLGSAGPPAGERMAPPPAPSSVRPDLPRALDAPILAALGPATSRPTAAAFAAAVSTAMRTDPSPPGPYSPALAPLVPVDPLATTVADMAVVELGLRHRWRRPARGGRSMRTPAIVGSLMFTGALLVVATAGILDADKGGKNGILADARGPVPARPSSPAAGPGRSPAASHPQLVVVPARPVLPDARVVRWTPPSPGHGGTPPGHGGTPPGHGGTPPGQAKDKAKDKD